MNRPIDALQRLVYFSFYDYDTVYNALHVLEIIREIYNQNKNKISPAIIGKTETTFVLDETGIKIDNAILRELEEVLKDE